MSKRRKNSSSSDDDGMLEAFKEATDTQFLNEAMFQRSNKSENSTTPQATVPLKSLRRTREDAEQENEFGVSQHFKDFVATQLTKTLDRNVEETNHEFSPTVGEKQQKKNHPPLGVKLLRSSKVNLSEVATEEQHDIESRRKKRIKKETHDDAMTRMSRVVEAAVDPNWILSKASTKAWTDKRKGTIYEYKKLQNGIIVETNNT